MVFASSISFSSRRTAWTQKTALLVPRSSGTQLSAASSRGGLACGVYHRCMSAPQEPRFQDRLLSYWVAELPRREEVPGGLFAAFPRATDLLKVGLRHPTKRVQLQTLVFLQHFDEGFEHKVVEERDERGRPRQWWIDERKYPVFAAAVADLLPDILLLLEANPPIEAPADLLSRSKDETVQILRLATSVLGRFEEAAAPAVPTLISWLGNRRQDIACHVLGRIGEKAAGAAPRLMELIDDRSVPQIVRVGLVDVLGRVRTDDRRAVNVLVAAIKEDDPEMRLFAAHALWYLDRRAATAAPALVTAARDPVARVRAQAIQALARVNPRGDVAIPVIAEALEDPLQEIRQAAMFALRDLRECSDETIRLFRRAFHSEGDDLRRQAFSGMAFAAGHRLRGDLRVQLAKEFRSVLRAGDSELRELAITGLANLGCDQNECVKIFREGTTRGSAEERSTALMGLSNSGSSDRETLEAYKLAYSDPDGKIRSGAVLFRPSWKWSDPPVR